jgi:hypothetical protein
LKDLPLNEEIIITLEQHDEGVWFKFLKLIKRLFGSN